VVLLGPPGQHHESVGVGQRYHVAFVDAAETLDRRAVEAHAVGQGAFQFLNADRETLQHAQDIGKPEFDEMNIVFLGGL